MLTDVSIEPSNLCNANCVFCGYQNQTRPHQSIDLQLALRIVDQARAAGVARLGLTPVVGEPLVNRELEAIVRHARRAPSPPRVGITTNGLLLSQKRYLSLVDAGLTDLSISMTYPDSTEYARVYRSPSFQTLMRNLNGVLDVYQREQCEMSLGVRTSRPGNYHHALFERARSAGWSVERNVYFDDWSGTVRDALRANGFALRPLREKRLPCTMLYAGPHFLSDGRATACGCRDLDGKSELGLRTEPLLQDLRGTYTSGVVEGLRRRFRERDVPDVCVSCRHYNPQFAGESVRDRIAQLVADGISGARDTVQRDRPRRRHLNVLGKVRSPVRQAKPGRGERDAETDNTETL